MGSNKLSFLTDEVIPKYVRDNNSDYVVFVQNFFEYLEQQFEGYDLVANLLEYHDIDTTVDEYIDEYRKTYARALPNNTSANLKLIIKRIREFYRTKGSEQAYQFLFRAVYDSSTEFYYPSEGTLKASVIVHKLSEKTSHLTDSNYWQDFSYVLRTGQSSHVYEKMLYAMAHPAGLKFFAELKPTAEYTQADRPAYVDSWITLLFIDYIINTNTPTFVESTRALSTQSFGTGMPAMSNYLWERESKSQPAILADTEDTIIGQLDGQASEQHCLVFYNRAKQDINSFKIMDRYVEFIGATSNTGTYWDRDVDISTDTQSDISVDATNTINTAGGIDFTMFSDGDIINLDVELSQVNAGEYTISGPPTSTTITVVGTPLTIETNGTMGDVVISTRQSASWYTTPLRAQPTNADDTVHIVTMPIGKYANTFTCVYNNLFQVFDAIDSVADGLFFHNGLKIVNSDMSFTVPDGNGIRNVTMPIGLNILAGEIVDYYVVPNVVEEFTMPIGADASDLILTLTNKPKNGKVRNLQVFSEGTIIYPHEYTYHNGVLTIDSTLLGGIIDDEYRIEVITFDRDVDFNEITHNTIANQTKFELHKNVEQRRWAWSEVIQWEWATVPPADWSVTFFNELLGWTYNEDSNETTGDGRVIYDHSESIPDVAPWSIYSKNHGSGSQLAKDSVGGHSKCVRNYGNAGKYVLKFTTVTNGTWSSPIFFLNGNNASFYEHGETGRPGLVRFTSNNNTYINGSYVSNSPSNNLDTSLSYWYVFLDFDNELLTLCKNGTSLATSLDISFMSTSAWIDPYIVVNGANDVQIDMDYTPDISGVTSFPAGTVEGDWTGWNDTTDYITQYDIYYIPNAQSNWPVVFDSRNPQRKQTPMGYVEIEGRAECQSVTVNAGSHFVMIESPHDTQTFNGDYQVSTMEVMEDNVSQGVRRIEDDGFSATGGCNVAGMGFVAAQDAEVSIRMKGENGYGAIFGNAVIIGVK